MKLILGQKIGMSQIFVKDKLIPITLIEAGPCYVLQQKTREKDGYEAVQVGFKELKEKKIKKSRDSKGTPKPYRYIKEQKTKEGEQYKAGDKVDLSVFKEGDLVQISGISKGKGFQGAVKMWGFKGKFSTHGVKHQHRTVGSVGSRWPQRVVLGRKMPGRMGGERITVKNLKIIKIDKDTNLLVVRGAVPGRKGTLLEIRSGI